MGHADEGIVLTDHERETLAQLAESIGDPWLARQLAGQESAGPVGLGRRRPSGPRLPNPKSLSAWAGSFLVVAGAVLTLATFVVSTALASIGLVMMAAGLWRLGSDRAEAVARWAASRRAAPRPEIPATRPLPPRTPPGAA